jgi:hypothetical protein
MDGCAGDSLSLDNWLIFTTLLACMLWPWFCLSENEHLHDPFQWMIGTLCVGFVWVFLFVLSTVCTIQWIDIYRGHAHCIARIPRDSICTGG